MKAYDTAKQILIMREDEIIEVLDELAINWPNTYNLLVEIVKDHDEWLIGED
jgi:hypothetical protein